jgi:proline iminopeptidase
MQTRYYNSLIPVNQIRGVAMTELRTLFPKIEPFNAGWLKVSNLHSLYYEQVGNPEGVPVVFLHGGPGVGALPIYRRYFNPELFHAIIFSQRGAGRSTPSGELRENDTWKLVKDIELIREKMGIERWFVFGGSWGSTLALTYAQQYPDRVLGLVLRGIFLGRHMEYQWEYVDGASRIFPEAWERFFNFIPIEEHVNLPGAYYKRLTSPQREVQLAAAVRWYEWESDIGTLLPRETPKMNEEEMLAFTRIECHYMVNHLFLPHENYLLDNIARITHIPCWIAQGRYDIICPVVTAYDLSRAYPKAELHIVPDAGHSIAEPGIVDSLIRGMEKLAGIE